MLVIIATSPFSKFFLTVECVEEVLMNQSRMSPSILCSLLGLKRKKNAPHRRFLTNCSDLSINDFMYYFSLHIGMFLFEYPKLICSGGNSRLRSQIRSRLVCIVLNN